MKDETPVNMSIPKKYITIKMNISRNVRTMALGILK